MTISDITALSYSSTDYSERTVDNELGKDDFLNILVMQMANQNPLEPTSDTEFIAQLAQFSVLEELQNLTETFETSQAYSMVGKSVFVNGEVNDYGETVIYSGKVDGVIQSGGLNYVMIGDEMFLATDVVGVLDEDYLTGSITDDTTDDTTDEITDDTTDDTTETTEI